MKDKHVKIALYDPSGSGGIAQYTFELAESLARTGCTVTLITSEGYELSDLERNFHVWFLFKKSRLKSWFSTVPAFMARRTSRRVQVSHRDSSRESANLGVAKRLIGELKSLRFTLILFKAAFFLVLNGTRVVHFQWFMDRKADLRFMRLLRLLRFKIVYTVHDLLPHDEYTAENQSYYQAVYRYPDKLIVHSENIRKEMLELFTVSPLKLCVIPHGSQRALFGHFGTSTSAARRQLGIPNDMRVILFIGQIKRYKGLEYLLEAFEIIASHCEHVLLLIAGRVDDRDADTHRHYSALLSKYVECHNVRVRDEYVPLDQVFSYLSASDLIVLPYTKASQSGVLLAACAAGKPVVVTDTGGLGEFVRNSDSGFVVPPRDANAIAAAVITMLERPDLRRTLEVNARTAADTTYSWTTIAATTANLYRTLIGRMPCSGAFPSARTPTSNDL